jgi:polyisoprenoid-binding protein YceI
MSSTEGAILVKLITFSRVMVAMVAVSAAIVASANPTVTSVKAGTYKIESNHTQVGFSLSHFGLTNYSGLISGATGSLRLNPTDPGASKLEVTISLQSIQTTAAVLTEELKGDQWFDVAKFPQATFTSTKIDLSPKGEATITGNLTLHGVTRPMVLRAHLVGAGVNPINKAYTVGFDAKGTIKRSDFGVSMYAPALGDEVQLSIAGAFELEG